MAALKDTIFFKKLDNRGSDNSKIYSGMLLVISDDIGRLLEYIKTTFPDFPDHGEKHSYRILDYTARILGDQIDILSDTEIFCFILSSLFHDTGMALVGFSTKNVLRVEHPENASVVIDKYFDDALPKLKNKERIKSIVKYVCKAHGMDVDAMYKDSEFIAIDTINGDNVRNSVLSVLLRIGDLLDLDEDRTNWLALNLFPILFPEEAKAHNIRHLGVQKYHFSSDTLNVEVKVHNITEYMIWKKWLGYLDKEILYANTHLKKENISFPALSKSIKKDDNANFNIEDIRFELDDNGGIWEIISKSVYTNKFDFIREVIQNAIDATLIDTYLNHSIPIEHPSPRSWTLSNRATPIFVCYSATTQSLYIVDNGVGMSELDLRSFLFKVSGTGYRDANERAFPFPSIAKYGIGFVSCLINAERIKIYTAKQTNSHMQKVTLETGINQALIEKVPFDGYVGTTVAIKLKHQYSFLEVYEYISGTFCYPSVEICCINIDNLSINATELNVVNVYEHCFNKPYKFASSIDNINQARNRVVKPIQDKMYNLRDVRNGAEELADWIRENSIYDKKYSDKEKFADFIIKVKELLREVRYSDIKDIFPFELSKICEKDLFNTPDDYLARIDVFMKSLDRTIADQSALLTKYPSFYNTIHKHNVHIDGNWDFIVADVDEELNIYKIQQYNAPIDLSRRKGIILMKHEFQDYDEGIEYAAINGFLFNKGSVTTCLVQVHGYHEVPYGSKREKSFIINSYDDHNCVCEALEEEYFDSLDNSDEEPYLIDLGDDEGYALGMEFKPTYNVVSITNNEFIRKNDVDLNSGFGLTCQFNQHNFISSFPLIGLNGYSDVMDDISKIDSVKSVYCQDGIVIPFRIEQLFPIGYVKVVCNATHSARMPLNVTRHEVSQLKSDVDSWYDNIGCKIQKQIFQHVSKTFCSVKLDFNVSELIEASWVQNKKSILGEKSKLSLRKLKNR
ncbi:MAG: ATP-binding protein [Christensenellaceae bacterium]|nr:ATP-binding protein [Christensenellaceae bacterium]